MNTFVCNNKAGDKKNKKSTEKTIISFCFF
jgi:hypothetical protein